MNRRDSYEAYWADQNDVPAESMAQYRCEDDRQYRLPKMARGFRIWCAALDALEEFQRQRISRLVQSGQSGTVVSIQPLADRTEFALPYEKFNSFTALLADNRMSSNKTLQDFLARKSQFEE